MKFHVGDTVLITSGKDKGKTGDITRVLPKKQTVVVKNINLYKRHVKSREGLEGGVLSLERPLPVAKISLLDPKTKKPTRAGYQLEKDGSKTRVAKASGTAFSTKVSNPTKKATSKKAATKKKAS